MVKYKNTVANILKTIDVKQFTDSQFYKHFFATIKLLREYRFNFVVMKSNNFNISMNKWRVMTFEWNYSEARGTSVRRRAPALPENVTHQVFWIVTQSVNITRTWKRKHDVRYCRSCSYHSLLYALELEKQSSYTYVKYIFMDENYIGEA